MSKSAFALLLVCVGATPTFGDGIPDAMGTILRRPEKLEWKDAPASLPPGAKAVILEGDPTKPGLFVMRLKFPDGYRIAPHTHPKPERVTVLSGTLFVGMGATFDKSKGHEMPAGTYGSWPAGMKHFGWFRGETILQLYGEGPWAVEYVNPADDPRQGGK
jgi:quercetin dioxygenase-like cupin family protein